MPTEQVNVDETPPPSNPPPPSGQPTGGMKMPGSSMPFMTTINSALDLVKNPVAYITSHKDTPMSVGDIMIKWVAILAAIPFIATLIGDLWYYDAFLPRGFAGSFVAYAFVSAILFYILSVVAVYVVGVVIRMLAPTFGSTVDEIKSLKMAAFIFTPVFLIGALDIIPPLGFLEFLGLLYGLYILYLGLPILLNTPKDRVVTYVVGVVIATFLIYYILDVVIVGVVGASVFGFGLYY